MFEQILTIGPDYKKMKGGIASVIAIYSDKVRPFNFIASVSDQRMLVSFLSFFFVPLKLILHLLLNQKIKIIHIHGASNGSFYRKYILFLIGKYFFSKKIIYHIHGGKYHLFYDNASQLLKKAVSHMVDNVDCIICLSESWRRYFLKEFSPSKIMIVKNMVEENAFNRDRYTGKIINFLFLGNIGPGKGIFDLLNIVLQHKDTYHNKLKLYIGGDGDIESVVAFINEHKLGDLVEYVGWVSGDKKKILFQEANIFVLPSYNEGLPVSILEAMSYQMPIIATSVGGIPEIVKNNHNGFLVSPGNFEDINNAINMYLNNKNLINEHGMNSLEMVKDHYPAPVIKQITDLYAELGD